VVRFFGAGLLLGAGLVVFTAGAVGALPQALLPAPARSAAFTLVAAPLVLREVGLLRFSVPQNARLVPVEVQDLRRWGALQFGFEMGTGMRTYSPSGLPHVVLAAVLLVVPLPAAFALAAGFALGRLAMPLLSNAWSDDGSWTAVWARAERLVRPLLALTCVGSLAVAMLGP
jgi:hypothetical protein